MDADLFERDAEGGGQGELGESDGLNAVVHGEPVAVPAGVGRRRLHGVVVPVGRRVGAGDHGVRGGQPRLDVPFRLVGRREERLPLDVVGGLVEDHGPPYIGVLRPYEPGGVPGPLPAVGEDDGDRLALVTDRASVGAAHRQRLDEGAQRHLRQVLGGEYRADAGRAAGGLGVQRGEPAVGDGRADQDCVRGAVGRGVAGVAGGAGQLGGAVGAAQAGGRCGVHRAPPFASGSCAPGRVSPGPSAPGASRRAAARRARTAARWASSTL